jgi:hypothetical protein
VLCDPPPFFLTEYAPGYTPEPLDMILSFRELQ